MQVSRYDPWGPLTTSNNFNKTYCLTVLIFFEIIAEKNARKKENGTIPPKRLIEKTK